MCYNKDVIHKKRAVLSATDGGRRSVCVIMYCYVYIMEYKAFYMEGEELS